MIGPVFVVVSLILLAGVALQLAPRVQNLRRRLASIEADLANLQNAVGVPATRTAPPTADTNTREMLEFLVNQVAQINTQLRLSHVQLQKVEHVEKTQTMGSFDYQWANLTEGVHLPSDPKFMEQVTQQICTMTRLGPEWFRGKKVVDIGCGLGRFSFGLLSLGAHVTSVDQSPAGLRRVAELCAPYKDRLTTHQANILVDEIPGQFDLTFSFGVVHHTGNTYLATQNVCRTVAPGGKLFLMIYGYPKNPVDFVELNHYDRVRRETRNMEFNEKVEYLKKRFDPAHVHGWFDAISPRINDILTFDEVEDLLLALGFHDIQKTMDNRNLHIMADRR